MEGDWVATRWYDTVIGQVRLFYWKIC